MSSWEVVLQAVGLRVNGSGIGIVGIVGTEGYRWGFAMDLGCACHSCGLMTLPLSPWVDL